MEPTIFQTYTPFLVIAAIIATAAILIYGILQMAKSVPPGESSVDKARRSNKLMQYRIILQAIAVALFMLMLALRG
ncbi:MAG: twin transmembrane helix small protein [Alphaproteobacteria bacterium]|nr:MAG: twin transmembrane helix small protein [Alphaproteobacteria bacterium]